MLRSHRSVEQTTIPRAESAACEANCEGEWDYADSGTVARKQFALLAL